MPNTPKMSKANTLKRFDMPSMPAIKSSPSPRMTSKPSGNVRKKTENMSDAEIIAERALSGKRKEYTPILRKPYLSAKKKVSEEFDKIKSDPEYFVPEGRKTGYGESRLNDLNDGTGTQNYRVTRKMRELAAERNTQNKAAGGVVKPRGYGMARGGKACKMM